MILEAGKSKNMALASSWHLVRAFLLQHNMVKGITWWDRAYMLAWASLPLIKPLTPSWGPTLMPSSNLNYLPKASPICNITFAFRHNLSNTWTFGRHIQIPATASFFIHSSVIGHLCDLYILTIVHSVTMNMGVIIIHWDVDFISFE